MEHRQLGIGIVGAGRIGTLRARLAQEHPGVRFIGVADRDPARAHALAEKSGSGFHTSDNAALIRHPDVTAVIVSTDEDQHMAATRLALELGKPVLVEKPIALTLEDADAMLDALGRSAGSLHVGYSRRFKRRYLLAKEQIVQGRLGTLTGMNARMYNSRGQVFAMLDRNPHATPVVDSLTYYVDFLCWFFAGNPVREVWARSQGGSIRAQGYDCDDVTWAVLTLADGALVNLGISFCLPPEYPSLGYSGRVELLGTKGILMIDDDHLDQVLYTEEGIPHLYVPGIKVNMAFLGSSAPGDWAGGSFWGPLANETRAWLDHLSTGRPCPLTNAHDARHNLEITLAIEESMRTRQSVRISG